MLKEGAMTTGVAKKVTRYLRHTRAMSALEYAMLVGIIAAVIATAIGAFSGNLGTAIETVGTAISNTTPPGTPDLTP